MKKFIGGLIVGHIATNLLYMWTDGATDRIKEIIDYYNKTNEPMDIPKMFSFIMNPPPREKGAKYNSQPETSEDILAQDVEDGEALHRWYQRIQRIRSMSAEGYSPAEISDLMGISFETVQSVIEPPDVAEETS